MSAEVKPGYKQTEVGVIPEDWGVSTVGAEFAIQLGKMLDTEKNVGVAKPFLGNRAVQWDHIDLTDIGQIKLTPSDLQRFRLRDGDLLVCEGGEVGRAAIWNQPLEECYYQKALHRLRPTRGYNTRLMLNVLQYLSSSGFLLNYVTQTSIAHLPKDKFETVPIPHPATKLEQQRIAEALSDADALIEGLGQLISKKRQLKQGAMQELLRPKEGWSETILGDMALFHKGKGLAKSELDPLGTELCIHYGELFTKYPESIKQIRSRTNTNVGVARSIANDVLMPTSDVTPNGLATASCVLQDGVILGGDTLIIRAPRRLLNGSFLSYMIRFSRAQVMQLVTGITVYHLYSSDMKKFTFYMPKIEEQEAIVKTLDDMDAEIAGLETKLAKARRVKEGMMQDLLTGKVRLV